MNAPRPVTAKTPHPGMGFREFVVLMAGPGDMDLVLQSGGLPRVSCLRKPFGR